MNDISCSHTLFLARAPVLVPANLETCVCASVGFASTDCASVDFHAHLRLLKMPSKHSSELILFLFLLANANFFFSAFASQLRVRGAGVS